jgi:hypothetical protein
MIPGRLRLLIATIVFLIDDHDTKIGERSEQGRTSADRYSPITRTQTPPSIVALT